MALFIEAHYCRDCDRVEAPCPCCGATMRESFREADNCGTGAGGFQPDNTCATGDGDAAATARQSRGHLSGEDVQTATRELVDAGLTRPEAKELMSGVETYTSSGYSAVNACLADPGCDQSTSGGALATVIERLDRFLSVSPTYKNGPLYRSLGVPREMAKTLKTGATLDHAAYASTSSDPGIANSFFMNAKKEMVPVMLEITKYRSGVSVAHLSRYAEEKEVLFPRQTSFRITGSRKQGRGVVLTVEEV